MNNIIHEDYTEFTGQIVTNVQVGEKGVGMKVNCHELRDVFRIYIPAEKVNGEAKLKLNNKVKIHYTGQYASDKEVRMNCIGVFLDNGKP